MDFSEAFSKTFKKWKPPKKTDNRGNIEGLSKYLAHRIGGDPHLWTKCMAHEKLQGYDEEARAAICARVHKIVTGYWTREKKPEGWSPADNKIKYDPSKKELENKIAEAWKGGKGSGNWGHGGLAGTWGGSSPTVSASGGSGGGEAKWKFFPAEEKIGLNATVTRLGANIKTVDKKYARPEPEQIDISEYFKDNPSGSLLFEVQAQRFYWGHPKYLLLTKNPTVWTERWANEYEWEYRATVLDKDGVPLGHFSPVLSNRKMHTYNLDDFEYSFFENYIYDDVLNLAPDFPKLVGEVDNSTTKEILGYKGGEGSGNWGHQGLAGVWGGSTTDSSGGSGATFDKDKWTSMSIPDRKKQFFSQSPQTVDAQAKANTAIQGFINNKLAGVGERPNTGDLRADLMARVQQCASLTVDDNLNMITDTVLELDSVLELAGVDEGYRRLLTMDAVDTLVAQDNESLAHQLGDHGIHHIRGNILTSYEILKEVPGTDTPESIAEVYLAHIYHDTGYLTEPARNFMDAAHPRWSRQHYDSNVKNLVAEALGKNSAENISFLIESHAGTTIDWKGDPIGSAVRVSDNLGLFHKEKLPQLFRSVPQNIAIMEQLRAGNLTMAQADAKMIANINAMDFKPEVRAQLIKAAHECNRLTPKFTLGMMGGNIDGFEWMGGHLRVYLRKNSDATRLQKLFDLGQRQFAKFAETYGVDWQSFRGRLGFKFPPEGEGFTLLEGVLVGEKERKTLLKMFKELFDA